MNFKGLNVITTTSIVLCEMLLIILTVITRGSLLRSRASSILFHLIYTESYKTITIIPHASQIISAEQGRAQNLDVKLIIVISITIKSNNGFVVLTMF